MRPRRQRLLLTLATLGSLAACTPAFASSRAAACPGRHVSVLYRHESVRVLRRGNYVYACDSHGPLVRLGRRAQPPDSSRPYVGPRYAAAGRFLAYVIVVNGDPAGRVDFAPDRLLRVDLDTGHTRDLSPTAACPPSVPAIIPGEIYARRFWYFAVDRKGAMGWLCGTGDEQHFRVQRLDRRGITIVDSFTYFDPVRYPAYVHITQGRLRWARNGQTLSTPIIDP